MKDFNRNEVGMYNMNMHQYYKKQYTGFGDVASCYHKIMGLAAQGRIDELKDMYEYDLLDSGFHEDFIGFMKEIKPRFIKMAKIADRVENNISSIKIGESIGEYTDRKLLKNEKFMNEYNFFNDLDLKGFYDKITNQE